MAPNISNNFIRLISYYPFGMVTPGRSFAAGDGYRFGFNGKESDDEIAGIDNTLDFGARIYNPRLGKFLSTDPLTRNYAGFGPYQYSNNSPVWIIDFYGLGGVILGSTKQVTAVNEQTTSIFESNTSNTNWVAYELTTIDGAITNIKNYKDAGNTVSAIYYQTHGSSGILPVGEGKDGVMKTMQEGIGLDDLFTFKDEIEVYLLEMQEVGKIKNEKKREAEFNTRILGNEKFAAINKFLELTSLIDDGGTLILGGCRIASDESGEQLLLSLNTLTNNRINIVANQDATVDVIPMPEPQPAEFLNRARTTAQYFENGWSIVKSGENEPKITDTGKDLQLNSTGELYEFTDTKD